MLEEAGLIRRRRSDGDRRRTYVQLIADDPLGMSLATALPTSAMSGEEVSRVVFVCTRNTARSQLAAAAWARRSSVPMASAGTHPADADRVHPRALKTARRHGLSLETTGTRHLSQVTRPGDLLVAVCDNAYEEGAVRLTVKASDVVITMGCGDTCPVFPGKRYEDWELTDPAGQGIEVVRQVRDEIRTRVEKLLAELTA